MISHFGIISSCTALSYTTTSQPINILTTLQEATISTVDIYDKIT